MKHIPIKFWGIMYDIVNGCRVIVTTKHGNITIANTHPMDVMKMIATNTTEWEMVAWQGDPDIAIHLVGEPIGTGPGFFAIVLPDNSMNTFNKCMGE